jgi:uncharacterized protein (DUF983 family)
MLRCPRCRGFLYDSVQSYNNNFYKGMKHCMNCGRDWRLERSGKGRWAKWQMVQWPDVQRLRREIEERRVA